MYKQVDPFYCTAAWLAARAERLSVDNYLCQHCLKRKRITPADMVHHIKPLKLFPQLALVISNLVSLCNACHEKAHNRKKKKEMIQKKRRARVIVSGANEVAK